MLVRIPATLMISTADLHNELLKFSSAIADKARGVQLFGGGLSALVSFGTAFATADFHDLVLPATAWSYLFFGATCVALAATLCGLRLMCVAKDYADIETAFTEICRSKREYGKPDGTLGAMPLMVAGEAAKEPERPTEWTDYGEVQKNMRIYG